MAHVMYSPFGGRSESGEQRYGAGRFPLSMNAPPGFESDPESELDSEDEAPAVQQQVNNGPKFSWKALIKEPDVPGAPPRPSRKLTISSWMPGRRRADVIDQLNDELESPPVSPTKLKKQPQLEDLASLLSDEGDQLPVPTAIATQNHSVGVALRPDHSEELGQFLGVLGQFLMNRMQQSQPATANPPTSAQPPQSDHAPHAIPTISDPQQRPTWIPTHGPTLAAYDAAWSNHPPVPSWHPGSPGTRTPLPGFSTAPPTPGYPPPFYPHPPSLQPHYSYGENGGYYAPPMSPLRLQRAAEYMPNPWSPSHGGPSEGLYPREESQPRSRARTLVRKMMGTDPVTAQPPGSTSTESPVEPHGTLQTITTCIAIAKELQHALKGSKESTSKHGKLEHTLSALHKLINLLRQHRHQISSSGYRPARDTNDIISDVFRYLKSVRQYITPGIITAVIYLVRDWLENGLNVKSLIKSATTILEELNTRKSMQTSLRPAPTHDRQDGRPAQTRAQPETRLTSAPAQRKSHRPPSPASTISELELPPRGPHPSSAGPSRSRAERSTPQPEDALLPDLPPPSPSRSRNSRRELAAKQVSPPEPSLPSASGSREPRKSSKPQEADPTEPLSPPPPVPPPRSSHRPTPSQSAIDALKAKQKLQIERMRKATDRTVRLPPVGDLPQEDVKIHDGVAEMDEGIVERPPLRRVESDLQAARELATADSGPRRESLPVDEEKKEPSKQQVEEAKDLLREPTPLRGVIAADDVYVAPPTVTRDDNDEPDGVEAEAIITPTDSRLATPLPSPGPSRPPSPMTPLASPPFTPFATPPDSPLDPLDADDLREQVEDEQALRSLAETL